jgi:HD superfamily phosphohydrolase
VEHYLVVRKLMYGSVYNHRLNVVCNWLLCQAIAMARRLGPERVWSDAVMAEWLWNGDQLRLETYLANDDIRTAYHLERWMESGPPELAEPCRRLLERRLLKASAVSHLEPARRLELLAEARQLAEAAGFCADVTCGLQQRQSRGYHAYKGGLRLWDGERLEALEQRSALVRSLAEPVELAWLIHPAEVAPKLRQLING